MIGRIIEELLANPAQVGQRLLVERHAGPDAGMNEDIVADFDHILSHAEEMDMLGRPELRQPLGDLFEGGRRIARVFLPIASHRLEERTSELHSLMRISYAPLCLKIKRKQPRL